MADYLSECPQINNVTACILAGCDKFFSEGSISDELIDIKDSKNFLKIVLLSYISLIVAVRGVTQSIY